MCSAAIWSAVLGVEDVVTANVLVTAMRLEAQGSATPDLRDGVNVEGALSTCRSSILRAAVAVQFGELDQQADVDTDAGWLIKVQQAGRTIDHALGCMPADGAMWARSAAISQATAQPLDAVAMALEISQRLAPAEEAALRARLGVWAVVSPAIAERVDVSLRADMHVLLEHGDLKALRLLLASVPAWTLPMMRQELAALSSPRRLLAEQLLPALTEEKPA